MRNLIDVMNIPHAMGVCEITRTPDGFFLGREHGDCGFNLFIGRPSPSHPGPGRDRSRSVFTALNFGAKRRVVALARAHGFDVRDFVGPRGEE